MTSQLLTLLIALMIAGSLLTGCDRREETEVHREARRLSEVRKAIESYVAQNGRYPESLEELVSNGMLERKSTLSRVQGVDGSMMPFLYRKPRNDHPVEETIIARTPMVNVEKFFSINVLRANGVVEALLPETVLEELQAQEMQTSTTNPSNTE